MSGVAWGGVATWIGFLFVQREYALPAKYDDTLRCETAGLPFPAVVRLWQDFQHLEGHVIADLRGRGSDRLFEPDACMVWFAVNGLVCCLLAIGIRRLLRRPPSPWSTALGLALVTWLTLVGTCFLYKSYPGQPTPWDSSVDCSDVAQRTRLPTNTR